MKVSFAKTESILSTLPVGYYLKRGLNVSLSADESCSYYSPLEDKIVISFKQLEATFIDGLNDDQVESMIRCMLYHEISHAFLTPKKLNLTRIINIVEDERIETICKSYYLNVDFKSFVKLVNEFKGETAKDVDSAFYYLVRYRIGTNEWLTKLNDLLNKYIDLSRSSTNVWEYEYEINDFYDEFCNWWNAEQIKAARQNKDIDDQDKDQSQSKDQNGSDSSKETSNDFDEDENVENDDNANEQTSSTTQRGDSNDEEDLNDLAKSLFDKELNKYDSKTYALDFEKILSNLNKVTKTTSSAINAYSGVFNARSVIRDDYKYFVQQNRSGHIKQFTKLHLNLFIDNSGSFSRNNDVINMILKELIKLERKLNTFSLDIVTIDTSAVHVGKTNFEFNAYGGSCLPPYIGQLFNSLQKTGEQNINIVLFDGDMTLAYYGYYRHRKEAIEKFSTFNRKNTIIISDIENKPYIDKTCGNAQKVVFTNDYTDELYKNIINALQILVKTC